MNKSFTVFISVILLLALLSTTISASETSLAEDNRIYFDDGSYIIIECQESISRSTTTSKSKSYTYYNSSNVAQWKATLTSSYTYDGSTATCTSATCNVAIYKDNWYVVSKDVSRSGATATADLTMGCKILGITYNKKSVQLNLTCDKDGNFS